MKKSIFTSFSLNVTTLAILAFLTLVQPYNVHAQSVFSHVHILAIQNLKDYASTNTYVRGLIADSKTMGTDNAESQNLQLNGMESYMNATAVPICAAQSIILPKAIILINIDHVAQCVYSQPDILVVSSHNDNQLTSVHGVVRETGLRNDNIPETFFLSQNYPNPFNPTTKIMFGLTKSGLVRLTIYDILGKEVKNLVHENLQPGRYEASFDGSGLTSGMYVYTLKVEGFSEVRRMLLVK